MTKSHSALHFPSNQICTINTKYNFLHIIVFFNYNAFKLVKPLLY